MATSRHKMVEIADYVVWSIKTYSMSLYVATQT